MVVDAIYWLDQIQPSHRSAVGDKAFYLGLLQQRGYPVIPGFVVPATALQHFLAQVDWQEQLFADLQNSFFYVDASNPRQLQTIAQQIRQAILATPLSEELLSQIQSAVHQWQTSTVIFRSSFSLRSGLDPTISSKTTGLLTSQISLTNPNALAQGLKQAWSELFRARSLFYWQRLGVQLQQLQFAVLVQPIRPVVAAGEIQINGNRVEVEAVWGLGHALAQGFVDRYSWHLKTGLQTHHQQPQTYTYQIADTNPQSEDQAALSAWLPDTRPGLRLDLIQPAQQAQPVLTLDQLQQLVELAQTIQTEFGMSLLLEWILEDSQLPASPLSPRFHLTQLIPQFGASSRAIQATQTVNRHPKSSSTLLPPDESAWATTSPSILTGLAAASGRAIAPALVLDQSTELTTVPADVILIASSITPEQIIQLRHVAGVVTEQGGMTSHAAILAREIGIPSVVGVERAMEIIHTGDQIAIDGDRGEVYRGDLSAFQEKLLANSKAGQGRSLEQTTSLPLATPSVTSSSKSSELDSSTQVWLSLSQVDRLSQLATMPIDGVGLLRSELMLLELFEHNTPDVWLRQKQPLEIAEQIAQRLQQFTTAFEPRPVFYRALDLPLQAAFSGSSTAMPHPMLGLRGTLSYQFHPDLLQIQLIALRQIQQQGYRNIHLLLPFVRTVEEFIFCRQQVEAAGLTQTLEFQLWVMAEVPSMLLLLPDYVAAGVQGIAIGTNDLTQLLLGVDREYPQIAEAFNPSHPAVLRAIQSLIQTAHQLGIPCSICGQSFDRHPEFLRSLLEAKITAISVEVGEVEQVYRAIQRFSSS